MFNKLMVTAAATLVVAGFAAAGEYDAVFDDGSRTAAKNLKTPDMFYYGPIRLDSKGRVVTRLGKAGQVTKDTKVFMGVFDEKKKKWVPGAAVEGGVEADIFTDAGKTLRVLVTVSDDEKTIKQILVTNADEKLEPAPGEFDAVYKGHGMFTNGRGPISYVRVELDEKGKVFNSFFLTSSLVMKDTKIAMGKYNEKEDKWEAGEDIPNGVYNDLFKDPGAKNVYVRITYRADGRGIAEMLVRQVGEKGKK